MAETMVTANNTAPSIKARFTASDRSWGPVIAFLPARFLYSFLAQAVVAGFFALSGAADPFRQAAGWWPVYLTLADVLCLLTLGWLTRREGLSIGDLVGVRGKAFLKQLAWMPVVLLAMAPGAILASIITQSFYGADPGPMFSVINMPLAGRLYSFLVWPVIWVMAEDLVYLGYLLPRIEALSGKTWLAVLVVAFFWGIQHLANPFIADGTYLLARVLAAWAAVGGATVAYVLVRRRLAAMMGVHYLIDLATGLMIGLLPLIGK